MGKTATEIRQQAEELRANGKYDSAGDRFTRAFYRYMGKTPYGDDVRNSATGQGLYCLLSAALCYRLSGSEQHACNRCQQGILLVSDLREYVTSEPALRGLLYELQGDFECIARVSDGDDTEIGQLYGRAVEEYETAAHLEMWQSEPAFEWAYAFFIRVADTAPYAIDHQLELHSSPLKRITYKREHYPELIRGVIDSGRWEYETKF